MKKIFFLLFVIKISYCYPQSNNNFIKQFEESKTDSARQDIILKFYDFSSYLPSPDTMMLIFTSFKTIAQKKKSKAAEAVNMSQLGYYFYLNGDLPKGLQLNSQAMLIAEESGNARALGIVNFGMQYFIRDTIKRLGYLRNAVSFSNEANDKNFLTYEYRNLGHVHLSMKKNDSAFYYYQKAYNLSIQINASSDIALNLIGLGKVNQALGNKNIALEYYKQAVAVKTNNVQAHVGGYNAIALYFQREKNTDSAIYYAKNSYNIAKTFIHLVPLISSSKILKELYLGVNSDSALKYTKIYYEAGDSMYGRNKIEQLQKLNFDEDIRQQKIEEEKKKAVEQRKINLQYAAIAIGLIAFIILFVLLSRSIVVKTKFIEFFGVLGLLAVFEFINLFIHPYLAHATNDSPVLMLLILISIGALLVPLHHRLEKWITKIMVEKNKKIRLEAAKKTIATLEDEQS
jgi:tetratricopeptide (TPR) repeat protein